MMPWFILLRSLKAVPVERWPLGRSCCSRSPFCVHVERSYLSMGVFFPVHRSVSLVHQRARLSSLILVRVVIYVHTKIHWRKSGNIYPMFKWKRAGNHWTRRDSTSRSDRAPQQFTRQISWQAQHLTFSILGRRRCFGAFEVSISLLEQHFVELGAQVAWQAQPLLSRTLIYGPQDALSCARFHMSCHLHALYTSSSGSITTTITIKTTTTITIIISIIIATTIITTIAANTFV